MPAHRPAVLTFRLCLLLYPRDFRARFGREQVEVFQNLLAVEAPAGAVARTAWLVRCLLQTARAALSVRRDRADRSRMLAMSSTQRIPMFDALRTDLADAARSLRRQPGFTALALLIMTVAIGANTIVFSVVSGILWKPLPYADPSRLVAVWPARLVAMRELDTLRGRMTTLADIGGLVGGWDMTLTGDRPLKLRGARMTHNMLSVLGVRPALGRGFLPHERLPGADNVVVISEALWRSQFGADPAVAGATWMLDGEPHTVAGVLPAEFELGRPAIEIWRILTEDPGEFYYAGQAISMIGRLAPGTTVDQARADFVARIGPMRQEFGHPDRWGQDADAMLLHPSVVAPIRPLLLALIGAVGLMLLVASANLASLFVTRASSREGEVALRQALGAGAGRLLQRQLAESLLIAVTGGIGGFALAAAGTRAATRLLPAGTPRLGAVAVDGAALAVCGALMLVTALLFGLAPAWRTARVAPVAVLRRSGLRATAPGRHGAMVTFEIAITTVLLVGAGLMMQTIWNLSRVDPGFRPEGVLTFDVQPTGGRMQDVELRLAFYEEVFARIEALPGVTAVGATQHLPLSGGSWTSDIEVEGRPVSEGQPPPRLGWRIVGGDYFGALGIPVVRGRGFSTIDRPDSMPVVMVTANAAAALWEGEDPIGQRIRADAATRGEWATVVGVTGDVRHEGLDRGPEPAFYRPLTQRVQGGMTLAIQASVEPASLARAAHDVVWAVGPDVPVARTRTLEAIVRDTTSSQRAMLSLLAMFAAVSLLLALAGVYGVVARRVGQRTRELGVRLALGAAPRALVRAEIVRGARLSIAGTVLGGLGALWFGQYLASLVVGVTPDDPVTLAVVAAVLVATAVGATWIPARRAGRVDPVVALRAD